MKFFVLILGLIGMLICILWCMSWAEEMKFMSMVRSGNIKAVSMTKNNRELLNVRTSWGYTPLMVAADNGDLSMVRALVVAGADPNGGDHPLMSALLLACFSSENSFAKRQVVRFLLERGANPNTVPNCGYTPLICAVEADDPELVRLLLDHGANPWIDRCPVPTEPGEGKAPLMAIANSGRNRKPIVRMLSEARARWRERMN